MLSATSSGFRCSYAAKIVPPFGLTRSFFSAKGRPSKRLFASSFVCSPQLGSVNAIASIYALAPSFPLYSSPSRGGVRLVTKAMFERFTEKAIKVVMLAQEESRRLGHNFVGTEQILLGLIGESTGIAAKVLKGNGMNLKDARIEVQKLIGKGSGFVAVEIPFTPRAKRVLELALEEAKQLGNNPSSNARRIEWKSWI